LVYKHDIDTPNHITKYDAVRTVLYTSSGVAEKDVATQASGRSIAFSHLFSAGTVSAVFSEVYGGQCDPYSGAMPSPSVAKRYAPAERSWPI